MVADSAFVKRRQRLAEALQLSDEILLVGAGEPIPLPEVSDQTYAFRSHAEYFYLTGDNSPGGVVAFDPTDLSRKAWVIFTPEVTEAERMWEGRRRTVGRNLAALEAWLATRRGRTLVNLGATLRGVRSDERLVARIRDQFTHARRSKDETELKLLRQAAKATTRGFCAVRDFVKPGATERDLQIELEATFYRNGADCTGYGTIIGSGSNAAIMHFSPSRRKLRRGDFVLIDAGAEVQRYVIDVTRTYVAGGKPSPFKRDLFQLVLSVEEAAIARCLPSAEWKEIHLKAATEVTAGLIEMKLMHGKTKSLVEQGAHTLFFPHGLGHLVGLGVRDASGRLPGRAKDESEALKNLRMDLPLARGYVTTVEPGVYFIPAILNDPKRRKRYSSCVNWALVDRHLGSGGVRIEDTVLVADGSPKVLTAAIPKTW